MAEDQDALPTSTPVHRPAPRPPGAANQEAALGLEVARLFGLNPRLLVNRAAPTPPPQPEEGAADGEAEDQVPDEG
jgi:hypothetical protein